MNKKIIRFTNRSLATGFFIGKIPGAPGTYGSLLAILLLSVLPILAKWYYILPLIPFGTMICYIEELNTGIEDESSIVIDEIVGIFITFMGIELNFLSLLLGFFLFRLFDIWKPTLIDRAQEIPFGLGVMADDILAGILAQFFLRLFLTFL